MTNKIKLSTQLTLSQWAEILQQSSIEVEDFLHPITPKDLLIINGKALFKEDPSSWDKFYEQCSGDGIPGLTYFLTHSSSYSHKYFHCVINKFDDQVFNQKTDIILTKEMDEQLSHRIPCALNFYFCADISLQQSLDRFDMLVAKNMDFKLLDNNNLSVLYPVFKAWVNHWDNVYPDNMQTYNNALETVVSKLMKLNVEFNTYYKTFGYPLDAVNSVTFDQEIILKTWNILKEINKVSYSGPFNFQTILHGLDEQLAWAWAKHPKDMNTVYSRMLGYLKNGKIDRYPDYKIKAIAKMEGYIANYQKKLLTHKISNSNIKKVKVL